MSEGCPWSLDQIRSSMTILEELRALCLKELKLQECFAGQLWCIQSRERALIFAKPTKISKSFSPVEISQLAATQCPCDHYPGSDRGMAPLKYAGNV